MYNVYVFERQTVKSTSNTWIGSRAEWREESSYRVMPCGYLPDAYDVLYHFNFNLKKVKF